MASGNGLDLRPAFSALFSGNGQLIRPGDLTLGGCAAADAGELVLRFQAEPEGCGSTVTVCTPSFPRACLLLCISGHTYSLTLSSDDRRNPHLHVYSDVLSNAD